MVLDYSKWDKIELSDDSDIEVHVNVDKRSFINAKRRQIHEERSRRKQQIGHYEVELAMNGHLLKKIDHMIERSEARAAEPLEDVIMSLLVELSKGDESAPVPPEGTPSYVQMIAALLDTIKKEMDGESHDNRWQSFINKLKGHREKLHRQTLETTQKLEKLREEERSKITADDLHDGFSVSHINKERGPSKKKTVVQKVQAVEQLNAGAGSSQPTQGDQSASSGAEADVEEEANEEEDPERIEPSDLGRQFAQIAIGDYNESMRFIAQNPTVVAERETDGLLISAFNAQMEGRDGESRQRVHQALLLQYCRQLGPNGVSIFFKRITTPNHQAQRVFIDDVQQTYSRIRERAKELLAEREKGGQGVEQIQLHAVDPNTTININIPLEGSDDPEVQKARALFESFPPGLRRALESSSLDEVNKVLGKMSVEEAEEIVGQLGEGGMLSLESQILDATTEDGQKMLQEIEKNERTAHEIGSGQETETPAGRNKAPA